MSITARDTRLKNLAFISDVITIAIMRRNADAECLLPDRIVCRFDQRTRAVTGVIVRAGLVLGCAVRSRTWRRNHYFHRQSKTISTHCDMIASITHPKMAVAKVQRLLLLLKYKNT